MAVPPTIQGYKSVVYAPQIKERTKGKIRSRPISNRLRSVLDQAARAAGVDVVVTSGGQAAKGTPGPRTGSTRHDQGNAADLQLVKNGRTLDFTVSADRAVFESFAAAAAAAGATGIGAGMGYMGPHTIHVGFGSKAIWGAGGKVANAPDWLATAVNAGWNNPDPNAFAFGAGPVPPADVSPIGSKTLKKGMSGPNVAQLQRALNGLGYNVAVDGDFGPQTEAALKSFQSAAGLTPDGIVGSQTRPLVAEAAIVQNTPPVPRANPGPPLQAALDQAAAARGAELAAAPRISPLNISTVSDIDTPATAETRMSVSPVAPARLNITTQADPGMAPATAETNMRLSPVTQNRDPLGLDPIKRDISAQLDAAQQAIDEGWSVSAAHNRAGIGKPITPTPRPNPLRQISVGANSPLADPSVNTVPRSTPNFDFAVGPANAPVQTADSLRGPTPAQRATATASLRQQLNNPPQRNSVSINDAMNVIANAPRVSTQDVGGSPFGMSRAPDLSFAGAANAVANAPRVSAASAAPMPRPNPTSFPVGNSPVGAQGVPDSALRGIQMNFAPAPMTLDDFAGRFNPPAAPIPRANPLRGALPALPSTNVGMAPGMTPLAGIPQTALPQVYQPTPPTKQPTLDELTYGAMPPQAMGASAVPVEQPGMFGTLGKLMSNPLVRGGIGFLTGGPLGAAMGIGGALLGNAIRGGGGFGALGGSHNPSVAAHNARVAANVSASDRVGSGGASYGRRQSDGSVTGTTSSGTGYTSRNGGRDISVGGRRYTARRDGRGYSARI